MNAPTTVQTIWVYEVRNEFIDRFLRAYGPDGAWERLLQRCPGYLGTELIRDLETPQRFITIDRWQSWAAFQAMHKQIGSTYKALDAQCAAYTISEKHMGVFEIINKRTWGR